MNPQVSIIMGSLSDMPVMEEAARFLEQMEIPFEINALSAHRTPDKVADFARMHPKEAFGIIAGAGGAAHLPESAAAYADIPVIGVPVKSSPTRWPDWIPYYPFFKCPQEFGCHHGIGRARNAAIFAAGILAWEIRSWLQGWKISAVH